MGMSLVTHVAATADGGRPGYGKGAQGQNLSVMLDALPKQEIDVSEKNGLQRMYEEEKLARDVYFEMNRVWGLQIFANIGRSEQKHMDGVEMVLKRYGVEYPADRESGEFHSNEMAKLYSMLTKKGALSLIEALTVGATVEDLDIKDLQVLIKRTDNQDIAMIYRNLMKGSRNHLRSFTRQLRKVGVEYEPQYLSVEEVNRILSSGHERGPM